MNATALAAVSTAANTAQANSASQGSDSHSGTGETVFSQALAQQADARSSALDSAREHSQNPGNKVSKKTVASKQEEASESSDEENDALIQAALFIANESAGIRHALSQSGRHSSKADLETAGEKATQFIQNALSSNHTDKTNYKLSGLAAGADAITTADSKAARLGIPTTLSTFLVSDQRPINLSEGRNTATQTADGKSATRINGKIASLSTQSQLSSKAEALHSGTSAPSASDHGGLPFAMGQLISSAPAGPDIAPLDVAALNPAPGPAHGTNTNTVPLSLNAGVNVPLHSQQWGHEFGKQVLNITQGAHNGVHHAELRLDPPELGPIRISLSLSDNVAHAYIVSAHANVRSAIEQALPQLQQAFAQAGLSLGQADVGDQGMAQQFAQDSQGESAQQGRSSFGSLLENPALASSSNDSKPASRVLNPNALVDTFA